MRSLPLLALLLVSALWGSHSVVGKVVEQEMTPYGLMVWRFTFCAVCLLPFIGRVKALLALPRRLFMLLFFSGLCWAVLYPILYYSSLRLLTATESLLLVNTSPLFAALLAWLFLRERLNRYETFGICIAFLGVVVLVAAEWGGQTSLLGIFLAMLGAIAFAVYTVLSRALFQALPLMDVLLGTSLFGAILLWIVTLVSGKWTSVTSQLAGLDVSGWWQLLYIVIVVSTIAYALYGYGLKRLPAGISSAVTFYPQVLFAALLEWAWIGDAPSVVLVLSAILILCGTALMKKQPKAKVPIGGEGHGAGPEFSEG